MEKNPIYRHILFVGTDGGIIAAAGEENRASEKSRSDLLEACGEEPCIRVITEGGHGDVVLLAPCRFKGALVGVVAAWVDMETIRRHFFGSGNTSIHRRLILNHDGTAAGTLTTESGVAEKPFRERGKPETVTCGAPVDGTPFVLRTTAPASRVYGETHPRRLLLATGALGLLILGTAVYFVSMNTRNRILQARLEEAAVREAEIQEKNQALEGYRRNLERMVEERTLQLKAAQKELLQKATEAGRAQMATVVLHNIGNAVTPAMVHVEQMKTPAEGPVLLHTDKTRLMQTLVNLIRNSCEAMDSVDVPVRQRRIDVKTFQENGETGFEITDTGIGMETGEVEGLFEFGRSKKGSSGFGLTYCREFVEAHKGSIVLTSPGPGKGASVRVAFPFPA